MDLKKDLKELTIDVIEPLGIEEFNEIIKEYGDEDHKQLLNNLLTFYEKKEMKM